MKKSLATVAVVAVSALALSGCVKETSEFTVTKKQRVTGELSQLIDSDMIDLVKMMDEETPGASKMTRKQYLKTMIESESSLKTKALPQGVNYRLVSGKDWSGVKISFKNVTLQDANKTGRLLADDDSKKPLFKISLDKKKRVVFTYNVTGLGDEMPSDDDLNMGSFEPRYKVTANFPGKVISTNGKLKKRTVTWKGSYPQKSIKLKAVSKRK